MNILLRRRKLGRTSCREIARYSGQFTVVRSDRGVPQQEGLTVFRWGCTETVHDGARIVNKSEAIHLVSDKSGFRKVLDEADLCPATYFSVHDAIQQPRIDFVVRPQVHAQGRRIYRCRTSEELQAAILRCGPGYYISDFIDKVAEYRVFVCQGRAVWVAKKTPADPTALAWNVARGGRFDNVSWDAWPLKAVKRSIEAHNLSGLDFSGVDVMIDSAGECYILEINSGPSQTSPYRQKCVAQAFNYLLEHGKEKIELVDKKGGWKRFIHPGVYEKAWMVAAT